MKLMFCILINMSLLRVNSIIFDGFGQAYPNYSGNVNIFVTS